MQAIAYMEQSNRPSPVLRASLPTQSPPLKRISAFRQMLKIPNLGEYPEGVQNQLLGELL